MVYYPYFGRLEGKRVILYGAGNIGKAYYENILKDAECVLVAWVDKNAAKLREEELMPVKDIDIICKENYDFIIVAVADEEVYKSIKRELLDMEVVADKILWNKTKNIGEHMIG